MWLFLLLITTDSLFNTGEAGLEPLSHFALNDGWTVKEGNRILTGDRGASWTFPGRTLPNEGTEGDGGNRMGA